MQPPECKKFYYVIWQINEFLLGIQILMILVFGKEAYMHLHLWHADNRNKGDGSYFIKESLGYYFKNLSFKKYFVSHMP